MLCPQLEVRFSGSSSGVLPVTLGTGGHIILNLSPSLIPDDLLLSASCTKVGGVLGGKPARPTMQITDVDATDYLAVWVVFKVQARLAKHIRQGDQKKLSATMECQTVWPTLHVSDVNSAVYLAAGAALQMFRPDLQCDRLACL